MCKDLGGPETCEVELSGETFEELGNNSKAHVMKMVEAGDEAHLAAIEKMKNATPEQQQAWFADFQKKFEEAPEV